MKKKLGEGGKLGLKLGFLPFSQGYIISFLWYFKNSKKKKKKKKKG